MALSSSTTYKGHCTHLEGSHSWSELLPMTSPPPLFTLSLTFPGIDFTFCSPVVIPSSLLLSWPCPYLFFFLLCTSASGRHNLCTKNVSTILVQLDESQQMFKPIYLPPHSNINPRNALMPLPGQSFPSLPFPGSNMNALRWYVLLSVWLLLLGVMFLRFIHVVHLLVIHSFLWPRKIPLYEFITTHLSIEYVI